MGGGWLEMKITNARYVVQSLQWLVFGSNPSGSVEGVPGHAYSFDCALSGIKWTIAKDNLSLTRHAAYIILQVRD